MGLSRGLTSVYSGHRTLNNDSRQTIKPCQSIDNLLQGRELCYHIEEQCDEPGGMILALSHQAARMTTTYVNRLRYKAVTMPYLCLVPAPSESALLH